MLIGQGRPARVPVLIPGHPASSPGNQNILPQRRLIGLGAGRNVQMLFRERLLLRIDISGQSFPVTVTPQGPNDSLPPASRRRDCAIYRSCVPGLLRSVTLSW